MGKKKNTMTPFEIECRIWELSEEINLLKKRLKKTRIKVRFGRINSWPVSIDELKTDYSGPIEEIEVFMKDTYRRKGQLYYDMICGIGTVVPLAVENA